MRCENLCLKCRWLQQVGTSYCEVPRGNFGCQFEWELLGRPNGSKLPVRVISGKNPNDS